MITSSRLVSVLLAATAVGVGVFAALREERPETGPDAARIGAVPTPRVEASRPSKEVASAPAPATASAPATVRPSFDLIRVERNGDAVIAGLSSPKWRVELLSNGEVLGSAVANNAGEWVIIPDRPLAKKDQLLTIRAISPDGESVSTSQQSVVVGALGRSDKPIVVLDRPEKPGEVVQRPPTALARVAEPKADDPAEAPSPGRDRQVATVPGLPPATGDPPEGEAVRSPKAADPTEAPPGAAKAREPPSGEGSSPVPATDSAQASKPPPEAARITPEHVLPAPPDRSDPETRAGTSLSGAAAPLPDTSQSRHPPDPPPDADDRLSIETVEYQESGTLTITGDAGAGVTLRAYLNDTWLRDLPNDETRNFSIAFDALLATGHYRIRIDSVEPETGRVVKRVEVPFKRHPDLDTATGAGPVRLGSARVFGGVTAGERVEISAEPTVVVIRKGDNLWNISRETYGAGRRYTTIYAANMDQIRNPDLIYPKQIFIIPKRP